MSHVRKTRGMDGTPCMVGVMGHGVPTTLFPSFYDMHTALHIHTLLFILCTDDVVKSTRIVSRTPNSRPILPKRRSNGIPSFPSCCYPTTTTTTLSPPQALALTEKLLLVNPDPLVLWNKRRTLLLSNNGVEINIKDELTLTASCLQRNPKSYGAWFHRKWILSNYSTENKVLQEELQLTALLLQQDERNFHCWNYRSYCVGLLLGSRDGSWPTLDDGENGNITMGPQVVVSKRYSNNNKLFQGRVP